MPNENGQKNARFVFARVFLQYLYKFLSLAKEETRLPFFLCLHARGYAHLHKKRIDKHGKKCYCLYMQKTIQDVIETYAFQAIGESNPAVKQVRAVAGNTKPNPHRLFVAEGIWILGMCEKFSAPVESLLLCPEHIRTPEAVALAEKLARRTERRFVVSAKTFEKISERGQPDGLLALAQLPAHDLAAFRPEQDAVLLVLDGVEIPGNIGTMLRMADGAGLDGVFLCNRKVRLTHPKLIKGSQGAILSVPVFEFESVAACRDWLQSHGFTVYLADTRAPRYYFDEPYGSKTALVMGSERYGITREWYGGDHKMVAIPMLGKCDSLNVGVAATVLCYDASMKNKMKQRN